ncbi:MAG: DUF5683 domain-containing protein [Bacteroidota bacterium]
MISLIWINAYAQEPVVVDTAQSTENYTVLRTLEDTQNVIEIESIKPNHDPTKAALFSAAFPGLGQIYNKKYWKLPFVWGGIGAFGYFINWADDNYQFYRRNLIYEIAGNPDFPNETDLDQGRLKRARDYYRRTRDQLAIYGILFYFLQIVDAHVDAHLIEFDVNQDLSVKIEPMAIPVNGTSSTGLSLKIRF